MDFEQFLSDAEEKSFWEDSICFKGETYPLLFFAKLFFSLAKKEYLNRPTFLSLDSEEIAFLSSLNQSFLGQSTTYFLGELKEFKDKKRKQFLKTILEYQGQHKLLFFVSNDSKLISKSKQTVVALENKIGPKLFKKILVLFGMRGLQSKENLIRKIFRRTPFISLESACRLGDYLKVVNTSFEREFDHYLSFLLEPEKSFFTLSDYFFARNKDKFFKLWDEIHNDYPPLFWIAYWGEQVWRACYVRKFLAKHDVIHAKKMSARLPFSYIKNYYRNYSSAELTAAYSFLYRSDCALKLGSSFPVLDLFYLKHFTREFTSSGCGSPVL